LKEGAPNGIEVAEHGAELAIARRDLVTTRVLVELEDSVVGCCWLRLVKATDKELAGRGEHPSVVGVPALRLFCAWP